MATNEAAFNRLVEMGREQGFVTLDQVNATLPVDSMSQIELAQTLDRLERSGVSVEVDEDLTRRPRVYDGDEAEDVPDFRLPEPPDEDKVVPLRPRAQSGDGSRQGRPAAMTEVQEHGGGHAAAGGESTTRMAVVFGILLLLLVFAFVLLR
jgi:Sigma-70 factor, region 1.1